MSKGRNLMALFGVFALMGSSMPDMKVPRLIPGYRGGSGRNGRTKNASPTAFKRRKRLKRLENQARNRNR